MLDSANFYLNGVYQPTIAGNMTTIRVNNYLYLKKFEEALAFIQSQININCNGQLQDDLSSNPSIGTLSFSTGTLLELLMQKIRVIRTQNQPKLANELTNADILLDTFLSFDSFFNASLSNIDNIKSKSDYLNIANFVYHRLFKFFY